MEDEDNIPVLINIKSLNPEYQQFEKIAITSNDFTIGRSTGHSVVIAYLSISRHHCTFKYENNSWYIHDESTFGIRVNQTEVGKKSVKKLSHGDVISFEPNNQFVYKFHFPKDDIFEIPAKRIKIEKDDDTHILNDVKIKFEESQNFEIKHIEEKIQSTKQLQTTSINLKHQLQFDMDRKMEQLKTDFGQQIENLKGKKQEVEKQKALLIKERDVQLAQVKAEMNGKIAELMEQIQKHNEAESELLSENNLLKEKLKKEREDFLSELSRESSSKQDLLEKLKAKIKEQEEARLIEKKELEESLKRESEQLRLAQEKELKAIADQKLQRECELQEELANMKRAFEEQKKLAEQQRVEADKQLNLQMEQLKKLSDEEKIKMEQMEKEREQVKIQLLEAQRDSEKSLAELRERVTEREKELAMLAAERVQHQAKQSSEAIITLQEQLEKVKSQLKSAVTEKDNLKEGDCGEGTSKDSTLNKVGELMESELQCSICAELFIDALVLNCSHTFCKYCITMWKKKKRDCPICRSIITAENKSLVMDSFIEKMVQNLTEDMRVKRQDVLKFRAELVSEMAQQTAGTSRSSFSFIESEISDDDDEFLEEEEEEYERHLADFGYYRTRSRYYDESSDDSNSGFDDGSDSYQSGGEAADVPARAVNALHDADAPGAHAAPAPASVLRTEPNTGRRRRTVPGTPGSYYGGYGRCFSCGARGHWAPGCPFR